MSKQQYYEGGDSVCRNQSLQKMFMMLGRAEKAGSGADKIISGWKKSNWNSPKLEEKVRPDKVVLTMPLISILDDKIKDELVSIFGEKVLQLEQNKILTLSLALTEGIISNERLRYTLNIHKYDITHMLKDLCTDGYLCSDGIGRGTTYHLNAHQIPNSSDENLNSNLNSSASYLKTNLKRRCTKKELFTMIINCTDKWMSVDEISKEVNRNPQYLKGEIIPLMVKAGLLEREFSIPNHPAQKYRRKTIEE